MNADYQQFIRNKITLARDRGFAVTRAEINPLLKPHQADGVIWAVGGGCRALFLRFGLGKTLMQMEILRLIKRRCGGKVLVVCPLGVRSQFRTAGDRQLRLTTAYVTCDADIQTSDADILLTNYERVRDGAITLDQFTAITLDEGDVLRSDDSKTHHEFITRAQKVPYRFIATATPSPNDYIELIFYAAFLGVMDKNQAKTRFFRRDSAKADHLTLLPGKEKDFWLWCRSWGLFLQKPSELGYSDAGYELPPLKIHWECVSVDHHTAGFDRDGQGLLYRDAALSLADAAREKHLTLNDRIGRLREILERHPGEHAIIWHDLEEERHAIGKAIPDCREIYGSLDLETRETLTEQFSDGEFQYLATKPSISGAGTNFQRHCGLAVFVGVGFKFRDVIQAVHRIYRYLQTMEVNIYFIYAESESEIVARFKEKWRQYDALSVRMSALIRQYGLANSDTIRSGRSLALQRRELKGEFFRAVNHDCVAETTGMPDNSVHLICTSIPFSIQYEYSNSYFDFGHNLTNAGFFQQMDFLIPQLLRVLQPGRVCAVHVKDRCIPGNFSGLGMYSLYPFSDETRAAFCKHGFIYVGRITIATDVVRENNQTYRLGYSEMRKDGTKMGVGIPEYVLLFRKLPSDTGRSYADLPVTKQPEDYSLAQWQIDAAGFWRSSGNRFLTPEELDGMDIAAIQEWFKAFSRSTVYNDSEHVRIGEQLQKSDRLSKEYSIIAPESVNPDVWTDITRCRTLNTLQSQRNRQQHICPLPFDIPKRLIVRYTNAGENVLDPFAGLMTVPFMAVTLGRVGIGIELDPVSFDEGTHYLQAAEDERTVPTLFDVSQY